jgi:hypothetical protein
MRATAFPMVGGPDDESGRRDGGSASGKVDHGDGWLRRPLMEVQLEALTDTMTITAIGVHRRVIPPDLTLMTD